MESTLRTSLTNRKLPLKAIGWALVLVPAVALLGWQFEIPTLKGFGEQLTPMNPLSAICFAAIGLGTILPFGARWAQIARIIVAGLVASIGGGRVAADLLHVAWHFDQILFHSKIFEDGIPNQMALSTAFCFMLCQLGYLLSLQRSKNFLIAGQLLAILGGMVAFSNVNGYALRVINRQGADIPMSLNSAMMAILVSISILLQTSGTGVMRVISTPNSSGRTGRRLLCMAFFLPVGLCLSFEALRHTLDKGLNIDESVLVTLLTASFAVSVWISAFVANRSEDLALLLEEKNLQSSRFLRSMLDAVPSPLFLKDRQGRFVLANRASGEIFCGTSADALIGKSSRELFSNSREIEGREEAEAFVLEQGISLRVFQESFTDSTGKEIWFQTDRVPIPTPDGSETNVLVVAVDITDRVLADRRIEESSKEILDLYDNAPCGYHSLDADGLIVQMNKTELDWLGYSSDEVVGKMMYTHLIPAKIHETFWEEYREFQLNGVLVDREMTLIRKDGTRVPVMISSKAVRDESGRYLQNRSTLFDLTDRHRAEQLVNQARDEAQRANLAKSEFLSRMSHELRTPLNAVLGFAQVLEFERHGASVDEAAQHILRGGRHLLAMINEILDLSRIDTGSLSVSMEPVELGSLLRDAIGLVRPLADARRVTIQLNETNQVGQHVFADHQRLRQICINLLSNAIKYNVEQGVVDVLWRLDGDRVEVQVADSGIGIPEGRESDLFAPFCRLGAESVGIEGTGLGLALSRGLAQHMGGSLTYRPNQPSGSIFILEMRAAEGLNLTLEEGGHLDKREPLPLGSKRILLIEDNRSNVELMRRVMRDFAEVELRVATTGSRGIDLAFQDLPDLILLDVNLPDISGLEVIRALKACAETRALKILVISADATDQQIRTMLDAGAIEYLTKPLDMNRFYEVLNENLSEERRVA